MYFREECSAKGGTSDGSCASGFGVCCVSKCFKIKDTIAQVTSTHFFLQQLLWAAEVHRAKTTLTSFKDQPQVHLQVPAPTQFVLAAATSVGSDMTSLPTSWPHNLVSQQVLRLELELIWQQVWPFTGCPSMFGIDYFTSKHCVLGLYC